MAHWERAEVPPDFAGMSRVEREGGHYRRYHPDLLTQADNALDPAVLEYAAGVSTALAKLGGRLRANPLPILYSTTIRSESISSSWIEGIRETPRAVAIAQLGDEAATHSADQIVRNVEAMQVAITRLGGGAWTHDDIEEIHHDLLPRYPRGYRAGQVWIGGTNKLNADYAAPPASKVRAYMDDLLAYVNSAGDLPVVQAAIVHAQFETIHPFADGNGRVGRALVHGILTRSGLVEGGVVPLSAALRHDERGYVESLTRYRYDGNGRAVALNAFLHQFLDYLAIATAAAEQFVDAATAVHDRWRAAVAGVRVDASLHRAVDLVVEQPVISAAFLAQRLGVSHVSAQNLVKRLVDAGIVKPATGKYRRSTLYQADDILALLALGAEADTRDPATAASAGNAAPVALVSRCGQPTRNGPCRNRVAPGKRSCWRHPG